jgi:hypothetical protein
MRPPRLYIALDSVFAHVRIPPSIRVARDVMSHARSRIDSVGAMRLH